MCLKIKVYWPLVIECYQKNVCVKNKVDWPLVRECYQKNIVCVKKRVDWPLVRDCHQIINFVISQKNCLNEMVLLSIQNMI